MRIIIDARTLGWTGIGRYLQHLLEELETLDRENEYIVLIQDKDKQRWKPKAKNFRVESVNIEPYSFGEQLRLPSILRELKPDLVHFAQFSAPLFYFQPYVVTIHDFTLVYFRNVRGSGLKKLVYELKYWAMRLVLRHVIQVSRHITTDAKFVRQEVLDHYKHDLFPIKPTKVTAIPLAVDFKRFTPAKPDYLREEQDFILYVGNWYPNKNIGRLLEALALLGKKQSATKLVLVGKADYFQEKLQEKAMKLGIGNQVIFPGFVPDEQLAWLYENAKVFAYVSLSEGFGLPGLEAMAAGTPVLSARASCLPEVYGEAADYCDPKNAKDIASHISSLLADATLRKELSAKGLKRVKDFSWKTTAQETLAVYRTADHTPGFWRWFFGSRSR